MARSRTRVNRGPGHDLLWAPWRSAYVSGSHARRGCVFCLRSMTAAERRTRLVLYTDKSGLVMLNRYPYNAGHLMVAPRRHRDSIEGLSPRERSHLMELVNGSLQILRRAFAPEGFNVGFNLGDVAGAGFADHLHCHVVPRWKGDNNFMPVIASTRVISEHLEAIYQRLEPLFSKQMTALS